MALSIQIAKLKFHQYELRAVSPNLILAKVTRYTVYDFSNSLYCIVGNFQGVQFLQFSQLVPELDPRNKHICT